MRRLRSLSVSWRIFALCVAVQLLVAGVFAAVLYRDFTGRIGGSVEHLLTRELRLIVADAAGRLDGDRLRVVYREKDTTSEAYRAMQQALRDVQQHHGITTDIYTLHMAGDHTRFGLTCKPDPLMHVEYLLKPEMGPAFAGQGIATTGVYKDDSGWWISAYAPVKDAAGRVVAVVEADHDLAAYARETGERVLTASLMVLGLALLFSVPLAFLLARRITRPLKQLTLAAERISQGDVADVPLDADAPGEVGQLAESFERAVVATRYFISRVEELEANRKDERPPP